MRRIGNPRWQARNRSRLFVVSCFLLRLADVSFLHCGDNIHLMISPIVSNNKPTNKPFALTWLIISRLNHTQPHQPSNAKQSNRQQHVINIIDNGTISHTHRGSVFNGMFSRDGNHQTRIPNHGVSLFYERGDLNSY
jgi:hypothetical protein